LSLHGFRVLGYKISEAPLGLSLCSFRVSAYKISEAPLGLSLHGFRVSGYKGKEHDRQARRQRMTAGITSMSRRERKG